ncbi:hypothetical protein HAX54_039369 [Datura stramonium]|uniref:Uncharacterized protein n=1 Tax=Datura stramonium TaxID=4076 RepID=A0ABS8VLW0_DATST|nr:hypothetical protein [Datura stramonium]
METRPQKYSPRERRYGGSNRRDSSPKNLVPRNINSKKCNPYDIPRKRGQEIYSELFTNTDQMLLRPEASFEHSSFQIRHSDDSNSEGEPITTQANSSDPPSPTICFPMSKPTSFIIWNIRGANNDNFKRNFKELLRVHNLWMVALPETKMENHITIRDEFNYDDMIEVPAKGRSGGIVLLWLSKVVNVTHLTQSEQEIHIMIQVRVILGLIIEGAEVIMG